VRNALVACTTDHPDVVRFSGPDLALNAKQSLGLALVLHELGTNAGKYGALSRNDGRVSAVWQVEAARSMPARVQLEWRERHGPVVVAPRHQGFGTKLIEQASRYELDGEVEILYEPDGLVCRISFPLEGPT
jgi:two-component system CheB/CheR fusion protein